jgi:5-methylcytosine-specific restriction protein B
MLNDMITADDTLGEGFCIGHSYFSNLSDVSDQTLGEIIEFELAPLLKEYWYDEKSKAEDAIFALKEAIK